jgi:hypothetical protein
MATHGDKAIASKADARTKRLIELSFSISVFGEILTRLRRGEQIAAHDGVDRIKMVMAKKRSVPSVHRAEWTNRMPRV